MMDDGRILILLGLAGVAAGAAARGSRGIARASKVTPSPRPARTLREEIVDEIRAWIQVLEARRVHHQPADVIRSMRSMIRELEDDVLLGDPAPFDPWQVGQRIMGWSARISGAYPAFDEQSSLMQGMMARGRDLEQRTREQGSADRVTPFLALPVVLDRVPRMEQQGVSTVARSGRGFLTAYRRAGGDPSRLSSEWLARREAFIARHRAQVRRRKEPLWRDGEPTRRHLALIAWAYSPDPGRLESKGSRGVARAGRTVRPQLYVIAEKYEGGKLPEGTTDPLFWNSDPGVGFVDLDSAERFTEADRKALTADYTAENGFSKAARQVFNLPVNGVWQTETDARERVARWNRVMRLPWP